MQTVNLNICGMTRPHCAETLEHRLQQVPGVTAVTVSYQDNKAHVKVESRIHADRLFALCAHACHDATVDAPKL